MLTAVRRSQTNSATSDTADISKQITGVQRMLTSRLSRPTGTAQGDKGTAAVSARLKKENHHGGFVKEIRHFGSVFIVDNSSLLSTPRSSKESAVLRSGMALRLLLWAGVLPLYGYAFETVSCLARSVVAGQTVGVTGGDGARTPATYVCGAIRLGRKQAWRAAVYTGYT